MSGSGKIPDECVKRRLSFNIRADLGGGREFWCCFEKTFYFKKSEIPERFIERWGEHEQWTSVTDEFDEYAAKAIEKRFGSELRKEAAKAVMKGKLESSVTDWDLWDASDEDIEKMDGYVPLEKEDGE